VRVEWVNQYNGRSGLGGAQARTEFSGFFHFENPGNVELLVKVLDFGADVKVFWGQLTDLHFTLTVRDTLTGAVRTYGNTPGNCGGIDQAAFPGVAGPGEEITAAASSPKLACSPNGRRLCLQGGRFAAELAWRNHRSGASGQGGAVPLSDLTGAFFFEDGRNLELVVKALDFGGGRYPVLYGALSDLEYTLRVTDTATGVTRTYVNPGGRYCGGLDADAF
jgi:hypothetical protein